MRKIASYVELPSTESDEPLRGSTSVFTSFSIPPFLTSLCVAATLFSTFLSLVFFTTNITLLSATPSRLTSSSSPLRRPSQYINLDKIKHAHDFPPITNFPETVLQIHTNDSQRTTKEDYRMLRSHTGTVYSDDRHILITPEVSSIIQFRHLDYGMERCSLNFVVPAYEENRQSDGSNIAVWLLDTSMEIPGQMPSTWTNAPKRHRLLISPNPTVNSATPYEYNCRSNDFTTLELACPQSMPCHVDFWQNRRRAPIGGVYIIQRSSSAPQNQ